MCVCIVCVYIVFVRVYSVCVGVYSVCVRVVYVCVKRFTFDCRVCSRLKRCILDLIFGRLAPAESQSSLGGITLIQNNTIRITARLLSG